MRTNGISDFSSRCLEATKINSWFTKTYKKFRTRLADHLETTFEDMIVKRSSGTFYKDFTLTHECKREYASVYGYDDTDFVA